MTKDTREIRTLRRKSQKLTQSKENIEENKDATAYPFSFAPIVHFPSDSQEEKLDVDKSPYLWYKFTPVPETDHKLAEDIQSARLIHCSIMNEKIKVEELIDAIVDAEECGGLPCGTAENLQIVLGRGRTWIMRVPNYSWSKSLIGKHIHINKKCCMIYPYYYISSQCFYLINTDSYQPKDVIVKIRQIFPANPFYLGVCEYKNVKLPAYVIIFQRSTSIRGGNICLGRRLANGSPTCIAALKPAGVFLQKCPGCKNTCNIDHFTSFPGLCPRHIHIKPTDDTENILNSIPDPRPQ